MPCALGALSETWSAYGNLSGAASGPAAVEIPQASRVAPQAVICASDHRVPCRAVAVLCLTRAETLRLLSKRSAGRSGRPPASHWRSPCGADSAARVESRCRPLRRSVDRLEGASTKSSHRRCHCLRAPRALHGLRDPHLPWGWPTRLSPCEGRAREREKIHDTSGISPSHRSVMPAVARQTPNPDPIRRT